MCYSRRTRSTPRCMHTARSRMYRTLNRMHGYTCRNERCRPQGWRTYQRRTIQIRNHKRKHRSCTTNPVCRNLRHTAYHCCSNCCCSNCCCSNYYCSQMEPLRPLRLLVLRPPNAEPQSPRPDCTRQTLAPRRTPASIDRISSTRSLSTLFLHFLCSPATPNSRRGAINPLKCPMLWHTSQCFELIRSAYRNCT